MAFSTRSPAYDKYERVLCYHDGLLHDAKVMDCKLADPKDETSSDQYLMHTLMHAEETKPRMHWYVKCPSFPSFLILFRYCSFVVSSRGVKHIFAPFSNIYTLSGFLYLCKEFMTELVNLLLLPEKVISREFLII